MDNVPPQLKYLVPYLQRAQELKEREPIVSYYCNFYAAKLAIENKTQDPETKEYLSSLLNILDEQNKHIEDREVIKNDMVAYAHIENFALKVFINADNQDRGGKATKQTAKTFLAASIFLEVLKNFGNLDSEIEEKIKYAKWKATDITKALKEGRVPTPGPPGGDPSAPSSQNSNPINDTQPSNPSVPNTQTNDINGTLASPQPLPPPMRDSQNLPVSDPNEIHATSNLNAWPNFPSPPTPQQPTPNINQHYYDQTPPLVLPHTQPSAQPFVDYNFQPVADYPTPNATATWGQQSIDTFPSPPSYAVDYQNLPSTPQGLPHFPTAPVQQPYSTPSPSYPSAQASYLPIQQPPAPLSTNSATQPATTTKLTIDPLVVASAQKYAKWAISALNYDDIKTAVDNLQKALKELEPYR